MPEEGERMTDTEAMHEALSLAREAADVGELPVRCVVTDGVPIFGLVLTLLAYGDSLLALLLVRVILLCLSMFLLPPA